MKLMSTRCWADVLAGYPGEEVVINSKCVAIARPCVLINQPKRCYDPEDSKGRECTSIETFSGTLLYIDVSYSQYCKEIFGWY